MTDPGLSAQAANLKSRLATYTVDRLKGIIQGLNEHCGASLSRSGKKSDLQDKLKSQLDAWVAASSTVSINGAKKVMDHIDQNGSYNGPALVQSLHAGSPLIKRPPLPPPSLTGPSSHAATNGAGPSGSNIAVPPAPVRAGPVGIPFKHSPFFEIDSSLSEVRLCPESLHMQDRKSVYLDFSLRPEQAEKLKSTTATYQIRIYCTTSTFYTAPTAFRPSPVNSPCPVEFPNTCELRVNNSNIHASTKGLKKKPGTAPPANAGATVRTNVGVNNKLEMIYCNNNPVQGQPPSNKKYFLQINLVKVTTVDEIVERLRKGKYRSKEVIKRQMLDSSDDDDDIVAGPQKVTLKCPLSYMRIRTPGRAASCPHPSCFDLTSWFQMMETTTTWLCPVCEKTLDVGDLIVDGFFDSILKSTHEDVEDVMLEANGEWHTTDNKYHSEGWIPPKSSKASGASPDSTTIRQSASTTPQIKAEYMADPFLSRTASLPKPSEEIVLSDDDDDYVHHQVVPQRNVVLPPPARRSLQDDVIDLTLESDEEDPLPLPTTASLGKRKERSPYGPGPSDPNKRARSIDRSRDWDDMGYGGSSQSRTGSSNTYGVRSSFTSFNNLPPLQTGGGFRDSSSAYVSPHAPPLPSPILQSPLRSPPFRRDPPPSVPVQLPPLMAPHPSAQYRPPPAGRIPLPPRPEWNPPGNRGDYRYDNRGW